jgi:hypothetical protein
MFICAFIDYVIMLYITWSPEWDDIFIMYDVMEGTGREVMIAPCKVLYLYVCVEWQKKTDRPARNDWYADQYFNTILSDQTVCNS